MPSEIRRPESDTTSPQQKRWHRVSDYLDNVGQDVLSALRHANDYAYGLAYEGDDLDRGEVAGVLAQIDSELAAVRSTFSPLVDACDPEQREARLVLERRTDDAHAETPRRDARVWRDVPGGSGLRVAIDAMDDQWVVHLFRDDRSVSVVDARSPSLRLAVERVAGDRTSWPADLEAEVIDAMVAWGRAHGIEVES